MDSPINNIDELLSCMLDGMLSQAELVELEREMAKNPSLVGRLNDISAIKRSMSSSRSTRSLRPDFASSVTIAAKKRAAEMGAEAPVWLVSPGPIHKTLAPKPLNSVSLRSWIYAGSLALAASLLFVFLSFPKADRQGIVSVPEQEQIAANDSTTYEDAKELLEGKADKDLVADADISPSKSNSGPAELVIPEIKVESVASSPPTVEANESVVTSSKPKGKPNQKQDLHYVMVLDVSIDPQAVENRTFEQILEKYKIVYTDDLVISDEQLKQLEDAQLVGNANAEEKIGVMFLRSTGKQLGLAIQEVFHRQVDFPECILNMSTDKSSDLLVKQLSSIKVAEGFDGVAKRLTLVNTPGNKSPFAASVRQGKPMTTANREKFKGGMVPLISGQNDMSNVLILMRPAKK